MGRKTVLVVGAAGGVGIEVARMLDARGYEVAGTVLNAREAAFLRDGLPSVADVIELDLARADDVEPVLRPLFERLADRFAGVIVCAAKSSYGPLEIMSLALAREIMEVNVFSDLAVYRTALAFLRQTKGRMIFLTSFGGIVPLPFIGQYVASKFALEGLCDVMRQEAAHFGVPVMIVEPGGIRTPMVANQVASINPDIAALTPEQSALYLERYEEFKRILDASYLASNGPEVIAEVVVDALDDASPKARYIAGEDAREFIQFKARSSDAEFDAFMKEMYAGDGKMSDMALAAKDR